MTTYSIKTSVTNITSDSRQVQPGSLFLAYPGDKSDGRNYIADAIKNGASAVIWDDSENFEWNAKWAVENQPIQHLRAEASHIASQFYHHPSTKMWMIGVTGTNGKTSISQWLSQCFNYLGNKTAVIGTLGNGLPNQLNATANTTPDAVLLQRMLADYVQQEVKNVAMEVSSHGLHQGRVKGVHFDIAVLSNLTRDHLDYHGSFEAYAEAKRGLFVENKLKYAVLNADDDFGRKLEAELMDAGTPVLSYGIDSGEVRATELHFNNTHFAFYAHTPFGNAPIKANLIGRFNVYNVLAVLATLLASKVSLTDAVEAISHIESAAGRMQTMGGDDLPLVVVDYAHTPDALEKVLTTLKAQASAKLICVFGCGGNRDAGKRALMGKIASEIADAVVVTSDNPRDENPDKIIQDIVGAMQGNYTVEADRAKAITVGILSAKPLDIVLIAGKGHEDYQEIAGNKQHFSDVEQAQNVLKVYPGNIQMMMLSEIAQALNGRMIGRDVLVQSVGTDSRNIVKNQLFIGIKGEHFDGNIFAPEAINQGAAAVLVSDANTLASPAVLVPDTRLALGQLAKYWREKFTIPLVAVTGSNGKTTVKEMIAAILAAAKGSVLATQGNLNNDIGLPLTLLKMRAAHTVAVIEMGMNHLGEIDYLTRIAEPTVALITNAGTAHIGEVGSRENIAKAKGEIYAGLADNGIAVINADDDFSDYWKSLNAHKSIITFGLKKPADVSASYQVNGNVTEINLTTPSGQIEFTLSVLGVHNIYNALAASAVAVALGVSNEDIAKGLAVFGAVKGRLNWLVSANGAVVIDDTYNANPDSMKAAIDVLASQKTLQIFVMGDMGELGADAPQMHADIGAYAKQKGITHFLTFGDLSVKAAQAFDAQGLGKGAQHFTTLETLITAIKALMKKESTVLVKGSRFMQMERAVKEILGREILSNEILVKEIVGQELVVNQFKNKNQEEK